MIISPIVIIRGSCATLPRRAQGTQKSIDRGRGKSERERERGREGERERERERERET